MKRLMAGAAVAMALTAMAGNAYAQSSATGNIAASATVTGSLTAASVQGLAFGFVIPNTPKTVALGDATHGIVEFSGTANAGLNISFTSLPTDLTDGTNNLAIGSYTAATSLTQGGAQTTFTPGSGTATFLSGLGKAYVHVGATVSPTAVQVANTYAGTIVVQAAYNGN